MKSRFTLLLSVLVLVTATVGKCPDDCKNKNFLYESFRCTPICGDNDDCPISYDCSIINQHSDMCFYNGQYYKKEESIKDLKARNSCLGGCTCTDRDNISEFVCYSASCRAPFKTDDGCISKRVLGECCSTTRICPPFSKCTLEGKIFEETENKFEHPTDNCKICTCDRGEGSEGVVRCQKRDCGDLLRHQPDIRRMCAPLYYRQGDCCPSYWICPEDKITFDENARGEDGPTCLFGGKTIKKNQKFFSDHYAGKAVCKCILPPFATCSLVSSN